jgi:hypothetical protein
LSLLGNLLTITMMDLIFLVILIEIDGPHTGDPTGQLYLYTIIFLVEDLQVVEMMILVIQVVQVAPSIIRTVEETSFLIQQLLRAFKKHILT